MRKIRFDCDYTVGTHPAVLRRLCEINDWQTDTYGADAYCAAAADTLRRLADAPTAAVHFLAGGTVVNTATIAALLRPWQAVLTAQTGHINAHEAGAIESAGHKCIALPTDDGRIDAEKLQQYLEADAADPTAEHSPRPGMVYLSFPTETGMIYHRAQLEALSDVCRRFGLYLYCDGARMAYGLGAADNDLTLADFARLCDAFTVGGTKAGLLFGEALVIPDSKLAPAFRTVQKQRGGMLAKGWLLGVQFDAILKDNLYFDLGREAVRYAQAIKKACLEKGFTQIYPATANQQFYMIPRAMYDTLSASFVFDPWGEEKDGTVPVRICTSWATEKAEADALIAAVRALPCV